jgi:hypothetical protein
MLKTGRAEDWPGRARLFRPVQTSIRFIASTADVNLHVASEYLILNTVMVKNSAEVFHIAQELNGPRAEPCDAPQLTGTGIV